MLCRVLAFVTLMLLAGCGMPDQPTAQSQPTVAAPNATASPQAGADLNATVEALTLIEMQAARATAASDATTATAWARQASPAPATPTINTTPRPRPTFSPADYTQVAMIDANATAAANYDATSFSLPPAPQGGPRPVYPTSRPQRVGILNCESVDPKRQFATWSCWRAETTPQYLMVRGGGDSGPVRKIGAPSLYHEDNSTIRGGVKVCTAPRADITDSTCDIYWRPEREGRLKIIAVEGMRLTLESVIGNRYVFNVETRAWEAAPAIPVPTATPLPTKVPPPPRPPRPTVPPVAVRPVLACVAPNADGSVTAWFGYENDNAALISIPVGASNRFAPDPADREQPVQFYPGRLGNLFSIPFDGNTLIWTLTGPDGTTGTATASLSSETCTP